MKVNEIIVENELDEALPGTSSNWFNKAKQITGLGAGAKELKLVASRTKQVYNGWLAFVPVLQKSGKLDVDPNDPNGSVEDIYEKYLTWYVSKSFRIKPNDQHEKQLVDAFTQAVKGNLESNAIYDAIEKLASELYISRSVQAPNFKNGKPTTTTSNATAGGAASSGTAAPSGPRP